MFHSRLLLIGEHPLILGGLRWILQDCKEIEVIGQAKNEAEAVRACASNRPDVVLIDTLASHVDAFGLPERLRNESPSLNVLLLVDPTNESQFQKIVACRANGYVSRDIEAIELYNALETMQRDGSFLSPQLSKLFLSAFQRRVNAESGEMSKLTPRQREVLVLLASGSGTKEIARKLGIGPRTVETHRGRIMQRLKIHDIVGLVHFALRMGLVSSAAQKNNS